MATYEVNFDGIVGPTHNYGGLSYGNIASMENRLTPSNPRQAALQGLAKMKHLMDLGIKQAVLPPHERPHLPTLRALGFLGSDKEIVIEASKKCPNLFYACSSASAMWTANAATVSPSADSADRKVHFTPANLSSKFHRSFEYHTTANILKAIFHESNHFVHHQSLPPGTYFADEGAANHTRFCNQSAGAGVQLFVFGRYAFSDTSSNSVKFPARQTYEASQAISRLHLLNPENTIFAQQNPRAIDAGVFHNDVISVGHDNLFMYHAEAFANTSSTIAEICDKFERCCSKKMVLIPVSSEQVSLKDAISSYLFNSQIVTTAAGKMELIAPSECQEIPSVKHFLEGVIQDSNNPISKIHYFNIRESMRNGGGPACLRLRVELTDKELTAANPSIFLTEPLYHRLTAWVQKYYRDRLLPEDLADPNLLIEGQQALDELSHILHLGPIYSFQKSIN